ncbi:MAG: signal peptidase I [Ruminococcus sp.]|nr:signal peptidase I [Ruminococcus sp.]
MNEKKDSKNAEATRSHKIMTIIGIIICVILVPILIINITLIIKSHTNKDDVPKIGGYCPLIVLTGSMEPEIKDGDLIIVKQIDGDDVKVGDVISFFDPESTSNSVLTHRVTEIVEENGSLSFRTKGDANNTEDKMAVPEDELVGIYKSRIPGAGNVAMFMQSTAGLVICVILPLILLVGYDIIRRRRYEKENQKDTAALLAELEALKAKKAEAEKTESNDSESK